MTDTMNPTSYTTNGTAEAVTVVFPDSDPKVAHFALTWPDGRWLRMTLRATP